MFFFFSMRNGYWPSRYGKGWPGQSSANLNFAAWGILDFLLSQKLLKVVCLNNPSVAMSRYSTSAQYFGAAADLSILFFCIRRHLLQGDGFVSL